MATGGEGQLTNNQIVRLARAISSRDMESIALGYLGIEEETIKNFRDARRDNMEAFNRDVIRHWMYKNPEPNQVQTLASLLYQAAHECSYVDPRKVEDILSMSDFEVAASAPKTVSQSTELLFAEFEVLAENLKPDTERAMKIEVAPWIRDYVVKMDELYCELELEKNRNIPTGEETCVINSYRDLFTIEREYGQCIKHMFAKAIQTGERGLKILVKGDPGIGKTTFLKKIGWDWAKLLFTKFVIVFIVLLKLVKPGEAIEDAIINQTPVLEGIGITRHKLESILKAFGNQCLIILDGLDEHALGSNADVLKMIEGRKYLCCNILVSSRPHSTRDLQQYFETVVRINGFTLNEARKFARMMLEPLRTRQINDILEFRPSGFREEAAMYSYPILLSFLCVLVRENEIDLTSKTIHIGEIYLRMVRCLYKKYTIRQSKEYSQDDFFSVLKRIGKLAFCTLLSENPLLRRSDVFEEVGPDAFDYGLLIGHEDADKLIRDETADIFVTFPHRSIQEFLGAFYFILMLCSGTSVAHLLGPNCGDPVFMMNPLFLQFCLWFLYHGSTYFPLLNSALGCQILRDYFAQKISDFDLVLPLIMVRYPAMNIENALKDKDPDLLKFFEDMLLHCSKVKTLVMEHLATLSWILPLLDHSQKTITHVGIKGTVMLTLSPDRNLGIYIYRNYTWTILEKILEFLKNIEMSSSVFVYSESPQETSSIVSYILHHTQLKKLEHRYDLARTGDLIYVDIPMIPNCSHLTHLAIEHYNLSNSTLTALSEANRKGNLKCLTHLSFTHCSGTFNDLTLLLQSPWPQLQSLSLLCCRVSMQDLQTLSRALRDDENGKLPNLTGLGLSVDISVFRKVFKDFIQKLVSLHLHSFTSFDDENSEFLNRSSTPNLTRFGMSGEVALRKIPFQNLTHFSLRSSHTNTNKFRELLHNTAENSGSLVALDFAGCGSMRRSLFSLLTQSFPLLHSLILSRCCLNQEDICILARANREGKISVLRKLDLSWNSIEYGHVNHLFRCSWTQLVTLDIQGTCRPYEGVVDDCLHPECFPSLEKLRITEYPSHAIKEKWPNLTTLRADKDGLHYLADAVEERLLPVLHTLYILETEAESCFKIPAARRLRRANINIRYVYSDSSNWPQELLGD